jgi:hypothetical protein
MTQETSEMATQRARENYQLLCLDLMKNEELNRARNGQKGCVLM